MECGNFHQLYIIRGIIFHFYYAYIGFKQNRGGIKNGMVLENN